MKREKGMKVLSKKKNLEVSYIIQTSACSAVYFISLLTTIAKGYSLDLATS